MSASRMFALTGASVFRNRLRRHCSTVFILSPEPPVTLINLVPSSSVCFPRYSSSLAAVLEVNSTSTDATCNDVGTSILNVQLWPEWVSFVDNLKRKGYFTEKYTKLEAADGNGNGGDIMDDMNSLKTGCLSFARDRFDIFKSLSKNEIQAVVDKGCPNILRKAVNAAKRLRAHLHLSEKDVCNSCVFNESCDRASSELKDSESKVRTVDIVRILMSYALDPRLTSDTDKTSDREAIEVSARNLLTELTELSETDRDDDLVDPEIAVFQKTKQTVSENGENNQMREGDWICPKCNFINFGRNMKCNKCREDGPRRERGNDRRLGGSDIEMKQGDWICPKCKFMNFARNVLCLKCRAKGPNNVSMGGKKPGDWDCVKCGFLNFASVATCKRCNDPRTVKIKGEWECPGCQFWNYSRNTSCKKCDHDRPK